MDSVYLPYTLSDAIKDKSVRLLECKPLPHWVDQYLNTLQPEVARSVRNIRS